MILLTLRSYFFLIDIARTILLEFLNYYNKNRIKGPPLKKENKVYLFKHYIYTKRLNNKLNFKKLKLFKIKRKVLMLNYKLKLLKFM